MFDASYLYEIKYSSRIERCDRRKIVNRQLTVFAMHLKFTARLRSLKSLLSRNSCDVFSVAFETVGYVRTYIFE